MDGTDFFGSIFSSFANGFGSSLGRGLTQGASRPAPAPIPSFSIAQANNQSSFDGSGWVVATGRSSAKGQLTSTSNPNIDPMVLLLFAVAAIALLRH